MKQYDIKVKETPADARLDKFIAAELKDVSRALARKWIEQGGVYVNKKRCKISSKNIRVGDQIRIFVGEDKARDAENAFVLQEEHIIFENNDIIVVNKPPFLPTHATLDDSRNNLALATQVFLARRSAIADPKNVYLGLHHRLDRDTSGIILFTKRKEANAPIAQAFQERKVHKIYLAISAGEPREKSFTVKSFLGPSPRNRRLFATVTRNGKYAETQVSLLQSKALEGKKISLLRAEPLTGRTHQIRVHLSEQGLPILADPLYGVEAPGVERLCLHAWQLQIGDQKWHAPMPQEFTQLGFQEPGE